MEGAPWDPLKNSNSPAEICDEYYTIYVYPKNNHIQAKEKEKKKKKKRKEMKRKEKKNTKKNYRW